MKKQFVLWALLLFCTIPTLAYNFEVDGIYYDRLGGDSVAVTYGSYSYGSYNVNGEYSGSVTIPDKVKNGYTTYHVTAIGDKAFSGCSSLTAITIPEGVTTVGEDAFEDCSNLTAVTWNAKHCADFGFFQSAPFGIRSQMTSFTLGNKVEHIPAYLCYGMGNLTAVTIPNSVTSIGDYAFYGCSFTAPVYNAHVFAFMPTSYSGTYTIPESITSIGGGAFDGCSGLIAITIPEGVTSIGSGAFATCSSLTAITIPESVTSIGADAFYGCSSLTAVTWNAKHCADFEYNYYELPFYNICAQITSFTLGNEVEHIPAYLCYGMGNLTAVTIPNSVTSIGDYAFLGCSGLTSITIPNSVTTISKNVFTHCSSLTAITIPNSVTSIGDEAFFGCSGLTSITIPENVTSIGGGAFRGCSSLTAITIPNSITSIGDYTFKDCSGLTEVTIPNSITSIGNGAFSDCSSLTAITIPESVTSIGSGAFSGCSNLTAVTWNAKHCADFEYDYYDKIPPFYNICSQITSFTLGNEVERIPAYLCYGMSNLTAIAIPNSVTSIGRDAFYSCSSLTAITIPEGVTSIGNGAFEDCSSLTAITIPEGVTSIDGWTFSGCSSLTSITIPEGVTSIVNDPFYGCSSLTAVTWNAKQCAFIINSDGYIPFDDIRSQITSFTLGNKVEHIPAHLCTDMSNLTAIAIPNSVTSIGENAFYNATKLRQVTIGSGIEEIGDYVFSGCTGLISLSVNATLPPFAQPNTFAEVSTTAMITVPCAATELYKAASYWNVFTNYQDGVLFAFSATSADKTQGSVSVTQKPTCDNDAVAIFEAKPAQGYKFVAWNDGDTNNPRTVEVIEDVEYIATFALVNDAVENVTVENISAIRKVFEDGTIYILRNGEKYTIDGRKVM